MATHFESTNHPYEAPGRFHKLHAELAGQPGGIYASLDAFRAGHADSTKLGLTDLQIDGLDERVMMAQVRRPNNLPDQAQIERTKEISNKPHVPSEHELAQKKMAELHRKYHVDFSQNGETVSIGDPVQSVRCRVPNLKELTALEAALKKNPASTQEAVGSPGVKFYFLEKDVDPKLYAFFNSYAGRNSVFIQPKFDILQHATNQEARDPKVATMEAIIAHELEHNASAVARTSDLPPPPIPKELGDNNGWNDRRNVAAASREYGALGWTLVKDAKGNSAWAMEAKDGKLYVCVPTDDGEHGWALVDRRGNYLNENGKPVTGDDEPVVLDDNQMRMRAKVRPITNYFIEPEEMLAEGMAYFHSAEKRAILAQRSPEYYETCKRIDQERINRTHGTKSNGEPNYLRDPNGELVPYNSANLAKVRLFEQNARTK